LLRKKQTVAMHKTFVRGLVLRIHFAPGRARRPKKRKYHHREEAGMAKHDGETIIKKYANRRLYNTGTSTYVTLDDLAQMVKRGEDFKVQDAKSSEDITHAVLTQIIVEQEAKTGNTLLPTAFLRQLISYYGDQMQMVVPTFLEHSMKTFSDQQSQMQEHMAKAFGDGSLARNFQAPLQMMEEQIRRNTELFRQAMQGFTPFAMPQAPKETRKPNASEIDELKAQLRALQQKLDQL
jgi:polyhydroxyalkanoate synthesis repressor PhaR